MFVWWLVRDVDLRNINLRYNSGPERRVNGRTGATWGRLEAARQSCKATFIAKSYSMAFVYTCIVSGSCSSSKGKCWEKD